MRYRVLPLLVTFVMSAQAPAAERLGRLRAGDPAPPMILEKLMQAPAGTTTSWESLKGKVVALEFWATWCGPCVEAIPHLNELVDTFRDKPVHFISITDEEESVVAPFLKKKPIKGWIGLDTDKSIIKAYRVEGWPTTFLVDTNGRIAGLASPQEVTVQVIEDLLAGKKINVKKKGLLGDVPLGGEDPLFGAIVRPSTRESASGFAQRMSRALVCQGGPAAIIAFASEQPETRMDIPDSLPEGVYDLIAFVPKGKEPTLSSEAQRAVETAFDIRTRREHRMRDVYVLTTGENRQHKLTPTTQARGNSSFAGWGSIRCKRHSVLSIAGMLESQLDRPVVDETGLKDNYDLELKWNDEKPESILRAVHEQLGLELKPEKRSIEVLVVAKMKEDEESDNASPTR